MQLWALANRFIIIKISTLRWWLKKKHGWFADDHLQVPQWVLYGMSLLGYVIPVTPLFIDGMILGSILYFGNEWFYQRTHVSVLGWFFKWVDEIAKWAIAFVRSIWGKKSDLIK